MPAAGADTAKDIAMTAQFTTEWLSPLLYDRVSRPAHAAPVARHGGPFRRAADAIAYVLDIPRRHAVLGRLVSLSDRELAAKGLSRGDLTRVFDADFTGFSRRA